jgi:hypothetical protein
MNSTTNDWMVYRRSLDTLVASTGIRACVSTCSTYVKLLMGKIREYYTYTSRIRITTMKMWVRDIADQPPDLICLALLLSRHQPKEMQVYRFRIVSKYLPHYSPQYPIDLSASKAFLALCEARGQNREPIGWLKIATRKFMTFSNTAAIAYHKKTHQIHLFAWHAILKRYGSTSTCTQDRQCHLLTDLRTKLASIRPNLEDVLTNKDVIYFDLKALRTWKEIRFVRFDDKYLVLLGRIMHVEFMHRWVLFKLSIFNVYDGLWNTWRLYFNYVSPGNWT